MRRPSPADAPGQDSFLDIVANLVGILIILVMVVGVRTQEAMVREVAKEEEASGPEIDVEGAQKTVAALDEEINVEIERDLVNQEMAVAATRRTRNQLDVLVTAAERLINERREKLTGAQQESFDRTRELEAAQAELLRLQRTKEVVENAAAPAAVVEHIPTPLARTASTREFHFRLLDGRLAEVPVEALEQQMLADVRRRSSEIVRRGGDFTGTVGPVGGFRLEYELRRASYTHDMGAGATQHSRIELDHYTLEPVAAELGEPLESALGSQSQFASVLRRTDPRKTTITVWVYPGDFANFRILKDELHRRGYITASRPLPEGAPIGGSPQGTKTVVQ